MATVSEVINEINSNKATDWPDNFIYLYAEEKLIVEMIEEKQNDYRRIDPWSLALLSHVKYITGLKVATIVIKVKCKKYLLNFEALLRRVSFLNLNSGVNFILINNDERIALYDEFELYHCPEDEVIREYVNERSDDDVPDRLEKDFQTFLFGKGLNESVRTNERLALLGSDFVNLGKKDFGIMREYPTGAFKTKISNKTKILPTEFIDIVTLNKFNQLSIIELKPYDSRLEVISQILDYCLFARRYFKISSFEKILEYKPEGNKFIGYVVSNYFHEKFDMIFKYYKNKSKKYPFEIKKTLLGYYTTP